MELGECFIGSGAEAAHINTVLGDRDGPVGNAWATALATPRKGHAAFVTVLQPGLPVQPFTLFVNKAMITGEHHARMTWGAAQAGVAAGVSDAVATGVIPAVEAAALVLIAAVWVDPDATAADLVFTNNREATLGAITTGRAGLPTAEAVVAAGDNAWNPFFRAPGASD